MGHRHGAGTKRAKATDSGRRFGAEWESHARTFMSWPALASVGEEDLPYVREDIARIARAVGEYEAVVMMARPDQQEAAQKACGRDVEVTPLTIGIDFNCNGWGNKQKHTNDAQVGRKLLREYDIPRGKSRDQIEAELLDALGLEKMIRITGAGDDFVSTYANFCIANDAVFMPKFGDRKADDRARGILQDHFPQRDVTPVRIDTIASGGGGIHCSPHDEPGKPAD
nr:agmatine deiminase family protein [Streptomyces sp. NRRL B-1347]